MNKHMNTINDLILNPNEFYIASENSVDFLGDDYTVSVKHDGKKDNILEVFYFVM